MPCDRKIVFKCITSWFGSLQAFEQAVRTDVLRNLTDQLSNDIFTYRQCVAAAVPLLWHFMDSASSKLHFHGSQHLNGALRELIRGLGWGCGVLPILFFVGFQLMYVMQGRCRSCIWLCLEVGINSLILGVLILLFMGALELEQRCWLLENDFWNYEQRNQWDLLPGTVLFTVIMVSSALVLFGSRAHAQAVLRFVSWSPVHPEKPPEPAVEPMPPEVHPPRELVHL